MVGSEKQKEDQEGDCTLCVMAKTNADIESSV